MGIVLFGHCFGGEELVGEFEAVHGWLEFFDDVSDSVVVFSVLLDHDAEEFRFAVVLDVLAVDAQLDRFGVAGVEDGVDGFGGVRHEIVSVEVVDENGEF